MIYTASYFEPKNHHGQLISISRSTPRGFRVARQLSFLAPGYDLLQDYKTGRIDDAKYVEVYWTQLEEFDTPTAPFLT